MLAHFKVFVNDFLPKICQFRQTNVIFLPFLTDFSCFCTMLNKKAELLDHFKPVCSAYFMLVKFLRLVIFKNNHIKALFVRALFRLCASYCPSEKGRLIKLFTSLAVKELPISSWLKEIKSGRQRKLSIRFFKSL